MDASRLSKRWIWGLVGTLFLAGLVLRLLMLRESAWGDEMSTLWIIRGNDFFGVISTVNSDAEISPPFFFLLAKVSSWIFGQTPTGIRIPSFVAGVLAVPMFYLVGIRALGRRAALYATAIAAVGRDEDVEVVGLSILSGSHLELVPDVVRLLREAGVDAPVIAGGIIPEDDRPRLLEAGVAAVYTPKDFEIARIMGEIADLVEAYRKG